MAPLSRWERGKVGNVFRSPSPFVVFKWRGRTSGAGFRGWGSYTSGCQYNDRPTASAANKAPMATKVKLTSVISCRLIR